MTDTESSGPQKAPSVPAAQDTPVALAATGTSSLGDSDVVQGNAMVASDALETGKDQGVTSTLPIRQDTTTSGFDPADPMSFGLDHPDGDKRKLKKYYSRQNKLIDQFLGAEDEERNTLEEDARYKPKIKFAVNASFVVNLCLFVIQMYAAISTGSLSLFATAADAFMDLVSSFVMLNTSRLAARPSIYKYPVIESARNLGSGGEHEAEGLHVIPLTFVGVAIFAKGSLMIYCLFYRRFPTVHVFFVDHRNDIVVNIFGLVMAIVGDKFVWYLGPIGAILITLLILFSWASNAFEQVWLLVGKSAPKEFIAKLIYMTMTHDDRIVKVDTCRAYHAGQHYCVELDIVMDENTPLRISHDVGQMLQRKLEGLALVERAFVHVDYEHAHNVHEEHKPLYEKPTPKRSLKDMLLFRKPAMAQGEADASIGQ
ncbi:uncharacterized protein B0T23DRAFT_442627 [Neurospora hispaniola]|uniref:Cation efflux protein transmembrane domain-containing protein n=1 Tax=Neurospora hispaniola TaxID=588809 RepID=A0AAJ0I8M9_9PEZI|nr:hypothetical protein B0T23DRAFT_442627 [Neurospora hispaniola]